MAVVMVKIGICEYYLEFENLQDIKKHFRENGMPYIGLDTFDKYDGISSGERVLVEDLSQEHLEWAQQKCEWGLRCLRGWKTK